VAYVVPKSVEEGKLITPKMLQTFSQKFLPNYMVPSTYIFLESLPLTSNGKIDRRALSQLYQGEPHLQQTYVEPCTSTEKLLANLWTQILDVETVGIYDNFFELGGDSLRAIRLVTQANKAKLNLTTRDIFECPTIAELAQLRSAQLLNKQLEVTETVLPNLSVTDTLLVTIQPGGPQPPLFCFAPVTGNVNCYFSLASCLGQDQPVYGVRLPILTPQEYSFLCLEAIAAHQITEILAVQPQGPSYLAGQSMGGLVAYEVAQQLHQQGQTVAFLALIDVAAQDSQTLDALLRCSDVVCLARMFAQQSDCLSTTEFQRPGSEDDMQCVLKKAKELSLVPHDFDVSQAHRAVEIFKQNIRLQRDYIPQAYAGKVSLFRASERRISEKSDAYLGWAELVQGEIEVHQIPGNHFSILHQPNVQTLATQLSILLKTTRQLSI
ncbi:MAG TPA: thioesterase domain-containing protein, partial [Elainellaceae cyanobacterium]